MIKRYYLEEIKQIWDPDNYYRLWLEIEAVLLEIRGKKDLAKKIRNIDIRKEEIALKEEETRHEIIAFLEVIEDKVAFNIAGLHKGLTSSDIMDTARIIQMVSSIKLIRKSLKKNMNILKILADKYKYLVMAGRTHGQYAEPVTLGLKFLRFYESGKRNLKRIDQAIKRISVGQISGAVGTYALISPEEEKKILSKFDLKPVDISSQIIPRDIFAEYFFLLTMTSSFAEEIALEIRLLSQSGINELAEPFLSSQRGSSAMPHKKNPVVSERICGLARLIKGYQNIAFSNNVLWNERDISHSSNERLIIEDGSCITYYILDRLQFILSGIIINKNNINRNLKNAGTGIFSSGVLKLLLDKGINRKEAYRITKNLFNKQISKSGLKREIIKLTGLRKAQIEKVLDQRFYIRNIDKIFSRVKKA